MSEGVFFSYPPILPNIGRLAHFEKFGNTFGGYAAPVFLLHRQSKKSPRRGPLRKRSHRITWVCRSSSSQPSETSD